MAIPLALIVNELVTNVVKHVGPPCEIRLRPEVGNALKLTISDTGKGPRRINHAWGWVCALLTPFLPNWVPTWKQSGCRRLHD